jgi:predicted DCC family thiol-disulfide oxidoreductase YuxK
VTGAARRPAAYTLIFDGDCAFCRRCVRLVERWDRGRRVAMVPFQDERALRNLPPIPRAALAEAMHLVAPDGSVWAGAAAAPVLLKLLPGGAPLANLFRLPLAPRLAAAVYRRVARNRHRLNFGERPSCAVPR